MKKKMRMTLEMPGMVSPPALGGSSDQIRPNPSAKIKITKRTHLSFFDLPVNTAFYADQAGRMEKNEPIFVPPNKRAGVQGLREKFIGC